MNAFDGTPVATITNANGIAFTMRLVRKGDGYGRELGCIHDKDRPLVEFYDARHACERTKERGGEYGQFVSRYYADTLLSGTTDRGLNLEGSVPDWSIDAPAFRLACAIVEHWAATLY